MFKGYFAGMLLGLIVTTGLFYIMQGLIANDRLPFEEKQPLRKLVFLSTIEEPPIDKWPPPPVQPPPPTKPPEALRNLPTEIGGDTYIREPIVYEPQDTEVRVARVADGTYLPIVKVSPQYPRRALTRGIEGYVTLSFTVTKTGAVENPIVVYSEPSGVFDRAAIKAALRFKYKPRVVNGVAVAVERVTNLIRFSLSGDA